MRYTWFIGLRYLRPRRSEALLSLITVVATLGVGIGVMTLDVVLSVMTGFEEDLRERILGFTPHVLVTSYTGSMPALPSVAEQVRAMPGVVAAAPFVQGNVMLSSESDMAGVMLRGMTLERGGLIDFEPHLSQDDVAELGKRHQVPLGHGGTVELAGIIIGEDLARRLRVSGGDPLTVVSPEGVPTPVGLVPRVKRFAVVGVFDSGMSEYDGALAYVDLAQAQRFFRMADTVTGVEVRVDDLERADDVAADISALLGFPYRVRDWMQMNYNLFSALKLEKTVYFVVLLLIVLVAGFNIVATLIMVVMEKRKDIAILKSMGATRSGIAQIFVFKGLFIGALGTLAGTIAGYALCWALERYEFVALPEDVFYVSTLPVVVYPEYFAGVVLVSLAICLLASIYPARQAARLVPVDVIRYE